MGVCVCVCVCGVWCEVCEYSVNQCPSQDATFDSKGNLWVMASNLLYATGSMLALPLTDPRRHAYNSAGQEQSVSWLAIVNDPGIFF